MIVRECRVYQQVNQSINHMREIREKSCLLEVKLQPGNMNTNNTLIFSGKIQENSTLEPGTSSESRKLWENLQPGKGNSFACYSWPQRVQSVTSRLGTGIWRTHFLQCGHHHHGGLQQHPQGGPQEGLQPLPA